MRYRLFISFFITISWLVAGCAGGVDMCSVEEVDETTSRIYCPDGTQAFISHGRDGTDGVSCTVGVNEDGLKQITCDDGTTVVVEDGVDGIDGIDGEDGASCSVVDNGNGTHTITCEDGTTTTVRDGEDGTQCTVVDNPDGTYTISCDDGTSATIRDGEDGINGADGAPGTNGADGSSCTVTDNGDDTYTLSCENGTSVTFSDGQDGAPGAPGAAGTQCTVGQNSDGSATLSCDDGSSVVITNGEDGADGADGSSCEVSMIATGWYQLICSDGGEAIFSSESCSVTDNGNGTANISCTDGSFANGVTVGDAGDPLVDLEVTSFELSVNGDEVTATVVITNLGPGTAVPSLWLEYFPDRADAPEVGQLGSPFQFVTVPLRPGEIFVSTRTWTRSPGSYQAWAVIDPRNNEDPDLGNNVFGPVPYTVP